MASLSMGKIEDKNKGIFINGFLLPFITTKSYKSGATTIVAPTFNKPNYDKQFKLRTAIGASNPSTQEEADAIYKKLFKELLVKNKKPSSNADELIDAELTRIKGHYGGSLEVISNVFRSEEPIYQNLMGGRRGYTDYSRATKIALEASTKGEVEAKVTAQKEGLVAAKAGAGIALASKQMIRQTSAEVKKKGEELENIKLELKEAKAKIGKGLSMPDIQKILQDTFVNGDPDEEDVFGFDEAKWPYIHDELDFVEMLSQDGQFRIIRRPTDAELNELVKYHNEHAQHQTPMEDVNYYYKMGDNDPEIIKLRQDHQKALATLEQQRQTHLEELNEQKAYATQVEGLAEEAKTEHIKQLDEARKEFELELASAKANIEEMYTKKLAEQGLTTQEDNDDENVSIESKEATNDVIDPTKSAGMSVQQRKANRASLRGARPPANPVLANMGQVQAPQNKQALDVMERFALRTQARLRIGRLRRERLNAIATANSIRQQQIDQEIQERQDFLNNVGIGSATVPVVDNTPMAETIASTEEQDKQVAKETLDADDATKQDADYDTKKDDMPDVSKFGYGKQVSKYAKQQGRDFSYTMSMVAKSKNAPSQNGAERKKQKERLLAEWGETIGIKKAKGNSYEECLEIYTIVFLAEDMYRIERSWKKATIKYLPLLENLSHQSTQQTATQTQLGMITMGQNPMTMAQADELIRETESQGSKTRGVLRSIRTEARQARAEGKQAEGKQAEGEGEETKADVGDRPRYGTQSTSFYETGDEGGDNDQYRRRLGGFSTEVRYSRQQTSAERNPNMSAGVQSTRQIKAQRARPPPRATRRDRRPKMNVAEAQFKMRKSRINPNLLFVNLDKQNPRPSVDPPTFRTRTKDKKFRRIKF